MAFPLSVAGPAGGWLAPATVAVKVTLLSTRAGLPELDSVVVVAVDAIR